jgi:hypothetical protein
MTARRRRLLKLPGLLLTGCFAWVLTWVARRGR